MNPAAAPTLDLRDIHAAATPDWWPPAPGWWVLVAVLLTVLVFAALWLLRRVRQRRFRRQILDELESLTNSNQIDNREEYIARLSTLLRRIALQRFQRERVASLTGRDWLRFLDETGGNGTFEHGVGQILENGAYNPHVEDFPAEELQAAARHWAKQNLEAAA